MPPKFPRINFVYLRKVLAVCVLAAAIFGAGYYFGIKGFAFSVKNYPKVTIDRQPPPDKREIDFNLFWRVWDTVHQSYLETDKIKDSELVYGAIRGMVSAINDPYTVYLSPEENKVIQEDLGGTFSGIGIQIGFRGNQLAVVAPLPGSPAELSGIEAGDFIVGIIDETKGVETGTIGMPLPEAVKLIRGPKGTTVNLIIRRDGEEVPIEIAVVREEIDVPSITLTYVDTPKGKVAHLKLTKFVAETLNEWEDTVAELLIMDELTGIVLDLRNNPGGYLDDAIVLASDFLEIGEVVTTQERSDKSKSDFKVESLGRLRGVKLAVLINGGSASASEILAGALRDHDRAQTVGEKSFGKGTIQESLQLDGEGGLHVTVAKWLTPSGFWVNDGGLIPDVEIFDNEETEEDEQLNRAVELVTGE